MIYHLDDLRQCSLVCRAWAPICQAHLFGQVKLDQDRLSESRGAEGIVQALTVTANSPIASYIKEIFYAITLNDRRSISKQKILPLLNLPNLSSLYIRGDYVNPRNFDRCRANSFGFIRFWDAYISSTSLVHLSLTAINDPPLIVMLSCPNLSSLSLGFCAFSDWDLVDNHHSA
ncbi:hypothetical protein BJ165DRAFT_181315 [Panaeolus papilionaceus]|nr:hypothetical protein BJ165DRAFT_181315 [Panaeolus papilionaceus]